MRYRHAGRQQAAIAGGLSIADRRGLCHRAERTEPRRSDCAYGAPKAAAAVSHALRVQTRATPH